ncbi:hypothetical protein DEO72_LG1g2259 [Vigna unguiculata]|uniref:Uncharacterized protein n=1 Tax=Vigna unguiculata TaxID=3917 RepID=A0A4D6KQ39_VIGUN|nr:hypothetical protein DEO72_LG1g2259 [Vigna unguiculata]
MGGHWWSKQELKIFKFGKGTQVKGAKFSRNRLAGIESRQAAQAIFMMFVGSRDGTAWRHYPTRQATLGDLLVFWVFA